MRKPQMIIQDYVNISTLTFIGKVKVKVTPLGACSLYTYDYTLIGVLIHTRQRVRVRALCLK
jgi:hypothetical protein